MPLPPYTVLLFTFAFVRYVQPSIEKSPADGTDGSFTRWLVPLNVTDVLGSLAIAPGDPSAGPLRYVPLWLPAVSAAVVPEVSPSRQCATSPGRPATSAA